MAKKKPITNELIAVLVVAKVLYGVGIGIAVAGMVKLDIATSFSGLFCISCGSVLMAFAEREK